MITLRNTSKTYDDGRVHAVRSIDLDVAEGELLVLLGESGCGKTTTLKMINRLIERSAGHIHVAGQDVSVINPIELRRRIGYVFQGIGLFPHMTVAENVAAVPRLLNWPGDDIAERVDQLLELVGLPPSEYLRRYPRELSGGQKQRVGVARALAARPSVLLMDEPFGALDPITRDQIQDELKTLQGALGLTIVLVTHDMTEALLLADRIAVMKDGRIVGTGTPTELMSEPGHEYVKTLMAMPKRQADRVAHRQGGIMSDALREQLALLPEYLGRHLLLTLTALLIGIGLSFPLAILVTRVRSLRGPVLALASAIQTIPSLALLALMVPLLRAIGFLPAVIALILYSMLPIIRNTVTGIDEVDPNLIEAGRGLGMTPRQLLLKVQLPLAMPVIIAGIRTATVWVVGIATLSTPVGATSLGNFIFSGLQTQNYTAVMVGCVAAAALALVLDVLIRLFEVASSRRSRTLAALAAAGVVVVLGGGLVPVVLSLGQVDDRPGVVVGAKTFTEQYILAALLTNRVESAGYRVRQLESLGSTVVFDALVVGRIDCYVDYTGTIWTNHMERDDHADGDTVLTEVAEWLQEEYGIECLGRLGFENTYALAMPRNVADRLNIRTIDDLFRNAPDMKIGGDYEFFGRPEWARLLSAYQLEFSETVGMDGTLMYSAVATGEIDVIAAFSTDGRIVANDLVVLDDPRSVFPPYDAVILLGATASADPELRSALLPLIDAIDDDLMRDANMHVDVDGMTIKAAVRRFREAME